MARLKALLDRVFRRRRKPTFVERLDLAFQDDRRVTLRVGALERSLVENQTQNQPACAPDAATQ